MHDFELALAAAAAGADIVRTGFGRPTTTTLKAKFNPVTDVDKAAETAIVDLISTHRPEDGILAEEGSARASTGRRWLIDPLDGTVNFVHGIPHLAVSVALYDGDVPLVGVVHDPLRAEVFAAERGGGATLNGTPISVSDTSTLDHAVTATGFPYDHDRFAEAYGAVVTVVLGQVNGIRRFGSAALDLAWVAAGRLDSYWEYSLGPWDMAAGILIAGEAGGVVSDIHGGRITPQSPHILAANATLHGLIRRIVEPILPEHVTG